mmetsp:Transcript_8727/g.14807  ORF Transcript_8727/g.14807 Transcript_8727/m.14807 type:complete len:116 (+) Transcript_8727:136-483(+)
MFEQACTREEQEAKVVFKWMFNVLLGNTLKKDLDFQQVLESNFAQGRLLSRIIALCEKEGRLSQMNAKTLVFTLVDQVDSADIQLATEDLEKFIGEKLGESMLLEQGAKDEFDYQ